METEMKTPTLFQGFPKIPRLNREVVVSEKIDGTNAQVLIEQDGTFLVGSRTRWIKPESDNYGFAGWCYAYRDELMKLGPGSHFGEWWGLGINRNYGLKEKRFSLFNTYRWDDAVGVDRSIRPACCGCVPILYQGPFSEQRIKDCLESLKVNGSRAVPGFMKPEGIVIFHTAANSCFKVTIEGDEGKFNQSP